MARGDHIKVKRMGGLYTHHGIDMGDGTVIHLSGEPTRRRAAEVQQVPMDEFLKGGAPELVGHAEPRHSAAATVKEARKHLGEGGYDLWRNNCEHFAAYCATGRRESEQITLVKRVARVAGTAAAATIIVAGSVYMAARARGRKAGTA